MAADPLDKAAYDLLPDGLVVADESGRVLVINPAAARLLDLSVDEAVGRDYRDVLPLTDAAGQDWWACTRPYDGLATRTGQPERALLLPNGRELRVTARYVREPERAGPVARLVVCLRDAAAHHRRDRARADLVSTVAHELRSPLTSVKGFTATLLAKWDRFTDEQKLLMLETVNADADRVTRLISELLDVSRIDSGRLELHRQLVDIPAAVRRIVDARCVAGEPPERFVVDVRGPLPEMWVDPDKLEQVVGNLVENALRHGAGRVTVTIGPSGDGAAVTVADEGEGISPAMQQRIFRRFWRGAKHGGTGLGLYIVKGLVEAHGGTISVGRAAGGGAAFRVTLPAGSPPWSG